MINFNVQDLDLTLVYVRFVLICAFSFQISLGIIQKDFSVLQFLLNEIKSPHTTSIFFRSTLLSIVFHSSN